ncbi:MAG: Integrase, catalytic core domain protein [Thermodesulfobacteriota bacterium]|nr:Integrase, catalytic core domain protein [Thermodesulfobacteriota bacterium]
MGYSGGYSILKDYIRSIRPGKTRGPTAPIDHPVGHEAQMDWSPHRVKVGGRDLVVHTGSLILCFSRWLHMRFFTDETLDSVIALHKEAFERIQAVPATITYDNMTTVGRHVGPKEIWINPRFKVFADSYDFEVIILQPGAKDRHGMVERPFHYIEQNCLKGREFRDFEHLQAHGQWWLDNRANVRIHGTLREKPADRLKREYPFLKPLPAQRFENYREVKRLIHRDFCVAIDTNRYSVHPDLIGRQARVRLYLDHLEIWVNSQLVASHVYKEEKYERSILPEHEQAYRGYTFQTELLKTAFLRLGEEAKAYFEGLQRERGAAAGYHLQRILKLANRYGSDVTAGALSHAMRYGVYSADAVSRVIYGKTIRSRGNPQGVPELVPENIKQWLRSCAVENPDPSSYDRLIEGLEKDQEQEE